MPGNINTTNLGARSTMPKPPPGSIVTAWFNGQPATWITPQGQQGGQPTSGPGGGPIGSMIGVQGQGTFGAGPGPITPGMQPMRPGPAAAARQQIIPRSGGDNQVSQTGPLTQAEQQALRAQGIDPYSQGIPLYRLRELARSISPASITTGLTSQPPPRPTSVPGAATGTPGTSTGGGGAGVIGAPQGGFTPPPMSAGATAAGGNTPGSPGFNLFQYLQQMQDTANQHNQERYQQELATNAQYRTDALGQLDKSYGTIRSAAGAGLDTAIKRETINRGQQLGAAESDAVARGIANTTVRSGNERGITDQSLLREQSYRDSATQQQAAVEAQYNAAMQQILSGASGQRVGILDNPTETGPDMATWAQLLSQAGTGQVPGSPAAAGGNTDPANYQLHKTPSGSVKMLWIPAEGRYETFQEARSKPGRFVAAGTVLPPSTGSGNPQARTPAGVPGYPTSPYPTSPYPTPSTSPYPSGGQPNPPGVVGVSQTPVNPGLGYYNTGGPQTQRAYQQPVDPRMLWQMNHPQAVAQAAGGGQQGQPQSLGDLGLSWYGNGPVFSRGAHASGPAFQFGGGGANNYVAGGWANGGYGGGMPSGSGGSTGGSAFGGGFAGSSNVGQDRARTAIPFQTPIPQQRTVPGYRYPGR